MHGYKIVLDGYITMKKVHGNVRINKEKDEKSEEKT